MAAGNLTVKGRAANDHQMSMMKLIVTICRGRGGDLESCAGAVATAIQESSVTNLNYGDAAGPDSAGLYQQRPSMGWGTPAQVRTPTYAINKFLDSYLSYRKQGYGWLQASHKTQRSAHPDRPAQWYQEGVAAAKFFTGADSNASWSTTTGDGGGQSQETREKPYEFSRGSADKRENSWDCAGRLADEVGWRRFSRLGEINFVSEEWLAKQAPLYRVSEQTRGVIDLNFDFETRGRPAQATLRAQARRYSFRPGDAVEIVEQGPADGIWLVQTIRRSLNSQIAEITLAQARPKLKEPAPETETINVGGSDSTTGGSYTVNASGGTGSGAKGKWVYAPGQGGLTPIMQELVAEVAGAWGKTLIVTSAARPGSVTTSGRPSGHSAGMAADFGSNANGLGYGGPGGDRLAACCMMVMGVDEATARRNIPGWTQFNHAFTWRGRTTTQLGWRTWVGGDHFHHVHLGL